MIRVCGTFDHFNRENVRTLEEASKVGPVELSALQGSIPMEEKRYQWEACRFVYRFREGDPGEKGFLASESEISRIPDPNQTLRNDGGRAKVIVTGCFDWLHSGHVRFFEEASTYGELIVVVGSDRNVSLLKGPKHPLFSERQRQYLVASIRFVSRCLVSTGEGWMDAAPEIARLKPERYIVNEDGDKPEKAEFCQENGLEYIVLKRRPREGLLARESTKLRGF